MARSNKNNRHNVSSTCIFREMRDETQFAQKLGACKSITIISPESQNYIPQSKARLRDLTLRELIEMRPSIAYLAQYRADKDLIYIRNEVLKLRLTPESQAKFGLVNPSNTKMPKGVYQYNFRKGEDNNKRLQWALDNTITQKWSFWVYSDEYETKPKTTSRMVNIALPPLCQTSSRKRKREEGLDENGSTHGVCDTEVLDFDEWANELIEWIGLAVLNPQLLAENNGGIDAAICDYFHPQNSSLATMAVTHLQGAFDVADIQQLWKSLQNQEWAILHVSGVPQFCERPEILGSRSKVKEYKIDGWGQIGIKTGSTKSMFDFLGY